MALLKFKRSAVPAKVPALNDLALGELAINTYDGKVYTKKDDGTPAIVQVGGGGGVQTISSADGSVTITGTTDINLSVPVTAATNTVLLPVRNNTGSALAKGTAVYINGALGQNPTVTKAIATSDGTSAQTLGLVTANINNNAVGNVTLIGSLTNLDTSAYSDGQQLYLSPTTAGALTATKPYAPNHLVYIAVVEHAHPTLGKLFVKVQNGYEMDELHDVSAQSPANNDGLFYNTSTSLWEKKSIATALGYTPYNATNPAGYITGSGSITGSAGSLTGFTNSNSATPISGPDNLTNNGLAYVTGISLLGQTDGALYTQAYSTSWVHQIYGDYRTGQIALRGKNSGAWQSWRIALDSGNYTSYAMPSGSSATNSVDVRAPIFYDSNNTAYYVDPNGNSVLNTLYMRNGTVQAKFAQASNFGYSSSYKTVVLGNEYLTTISMGVDVSGNASGSFNGQGEGREVLFRNGVAFITPNAANTAYETPLTLLNGYASSIGSFRAPIFYDSDNTGYYIDPASTSNLRGLTLTDGSAAMTFSSTASGRSAAFGMTDSYNMYLNAPSGGILYLSNFQAPIMSDSNNSAYYIDPTGTSNLTGLTVANTITGSITGSARSVGLSDPNIGAGAVWVLTSDKTLNFADGVGAQKVMSSGVSATNSVDVRAPIFYDSNNTGYYVDPNSTSNIYRLGSYTAAQYNSGDWNAAFQNTPAQSYGWHGDVSSGGPAGTWWFYESMRHSNSSNYWGTQIAWGWEDNANRLQQRNVSGGGFGGWVEYLNTSNRTYSGNLNMTGSIISTASDVRAPIFYDQNNTGFYLDPNSTSTSINVAGSIVAAGNVTAYSDIRVKANVETIPDALDKLDQIRGVTYTRTDLDDKEQRYAGVIAQEIEAVLPEAVRDLGNIKAVDYNATIGLLIQAVKELRDEVEALKK